MKLQSPLRRWDVVAGVLTACDAKTFVEIGCKEGRLTNYVLANVPSVDVIAIDPWGKAPSNSAESYDAWNWASIEAEFWKNVEPWNTEKEDCRIRIVQDTSAGAVLEFEDESVDVVFIDGAHDYDNVYQDILLWWSKIKPSGFMLGHDYQHKFPGVHRAVADHFNLMRVAVMPDSVWCVDKKTAIKL